MNLKYDVVIVGGGVAGISCAYNCAKKKLRTLLVEKENYLGGDVTGALVVPVMKNNNSNINCDFYNDLVNYAKKFDSQITYSDGNTGWFNPILIKKVFDQMLKNVGADILFESVPVDFKKNENFIEKVNFSFEALSLPIVSKYFVDATGNAELSKLLNCEFWSDTQMTQPPSLRFIVSGVDLESLANFLEEIDSDKNVTTTYRIDSQIHLSTAYTWDTDKKWALAPYFEKAVKEGVLKDTDRAYFQIFTIAGMANSVAFNCPRIQNYDKNNPIESSNAIIEARASIYRIYNFVKNYIPGFENSYISNIAPKIGKRETKRVKCKYDYTINDLLEQKQFDNPALVSDYPVDIHSDKKDGSTLHKVCSYMLPIESLKSKDYENLYIIGKIAGTDFKSQAALRVQSSCMSMGEAVAKDIFQNC